MGYELSAILGYGVLVKDDEDGTNFVPNEDIDELYGKYPLLSLELGCTDSQLQYFLLYEPSMRKASNWSGEKIVLPKQDDILADELFKAFFKDYNIKDVKPSWWLIPLWF